MFIANERLKCRVQKALCQIREILDFADVHPVREMQRRATLESADYIQNEMPDAVGFCISSEVMDFALEHVSDDGSVMEFGVFKGATIRHLARRLPTRLIHGFDSFTGLPESWPGTQQMGNPFNTHGKAPKVPKNVILHKGWFDKVLPEWVANHKEPVSFIHIDCDVYSSTKTAFELIEDRIVVGTVILFDEYFGYPNWRNHEYKAFQEFVRRNNVKYDYLAYARIQVAVRITSIR